MTIDTRALRATLPELLPTLTLDWRAVDERPRASRERSDGALRIALGTAGATVRIDSDTDELAPWIVPVRGRYVESWQDERATSVDVGLPMVSDAVAVFRGDDGFVLERTDDAVLICTIELGLREPPRSLVEAWLRAVDDGGVRARAQQWLATDRAWDTVSAAALLAWTSDDATILEAAERWMRQVAPRDQGQLTALLIGEADGLAGRLRRLGDDDIFRPYDDSWRNAFHGCRRLRARLAALAWWLARSGDAAIQQRVGATLQSLDQLGIDVLSESLDDGPPDPWLRSLERFASLSWWATAGDDDRPLELPEGWA